VFAAKEDEFLLVLSPIRGHFGVWSEMIPLVFNMIVLCVKCAVFTPKMQLIDEEVGRVIFNIS
jgi:hypothetical protein